LRTKSDKAKSDKKMKNKLYTLLFALGLLFAAPALAAQQREDKIAVTERDYENQQVEMADTFRSEGKIYVVVAVLSTIFLGMVMYLIVFERRLSQLERQIKEEEELKKG
jgi:septal ring factor EnvC (AmiA/AmiB activator)